jgi:hypothetical protein
MFRESKVSFKLRIAHLSVLHAEENMGRTHISEEHAAALAIAECWSGISENN